MNKSSRKNVINKAVFKYFLADLLYLNRKNKRFLIMITNILKEK